MAIETSSGDPPAFQWLGWSLPLFQFGRIRYRLNWTLMVSSVYAAVGVIKMHRYDLLPFAVVIPILAVFLYSQGKVWMLRLVRGQADSSMLWSLGDSMPMRIAIRPAPQFAVASAGGLVSLVLWLGLGYLYSHHAALHLLSLSFSNMIPGENGVTSSAITPFDYCLLFMSICSSQLFFWNLVPSSVFDGGRLWRAALWPVLGLRRATWIAMVGGFVAAALLIIQGIVSTNFFVLVFGLCILMASIYEWRSMKSYGFDIVIGVEPAFTSRQRNATPGIFGRFLQRREEKARARQEFQEQQEQDVLDRLLAKVSAEGLPALTLAERQLLGRISKQQKARNEAKESRSSY